MLLVVMLNNVIATHGIRKMELVTDEDFMSDDIRYYFRNKTLQKLTKHFLSPKAMQNTVINIINLN